MDDFFTAAKEFGPWVFILLFILRETLPKLAPDIFKFLTQRQTAEDRFIRLVENNTLAVSAIQRSVETFAVALVATNDRLDNLEDLIKDEGFRHFLAWFKGLDAYAELQKQERDKYRRQRVAELSANPEAPTDPR